MQCSAPNKARKITLVASKSIHYSKIGAHSKEKKSPADSKIIHEILQRVSIRNNQMQLAH